MSPTRGSGSTASRLSIVTRIGYPEVLSTGRGVRLITATASGTGVAFPQARVEDPRRVRFADGSLTYVLNEPALRSWGTHDDLTDLEQVEWKLTEEEGDARLVAAREGAEVDLLELGPDAARSLDERPEPLTVVPSFTPLGAATELGEYLVGGRVLTGSETRRKPVDAVSLSIYRIARFRGGPVWDAVADHVANVVATRVEQAEGGNLVHHIWTGGETHVRYLNDAILLLAAHAERAGEERWRAALGRACALLDEHFTLDVPAGRWVLHDSLERDDARNHWVLNTHLQAILALQAAGQDVRDHLDAAVAALEPRVTGAHGLRTATGLVVAETLRAHGPRRHAGRRIASAYERAAGACSAARALRLPGGWIARDLSGDRRRVHYFTVNLTDLAGVVLATPDPPAALARCLEAGVRFGRASGFFRAEMRAATPLSALIPTLYRLVGTRSRAESAAERARRAGLAPMLGWPGYEDALWPRLGDPSPL